MRVGKVKKDPWGARIQREVVEALLKMQEESYSPRARKTKRVLYG